MYLIGLLMPMVFWLGNFGWYQSVYKKLARVCFEGIHKYYGRRCFTYRNIQSGRVV